MVSDTVYDLCIPILKDPSLEEEDKTDQLEDLLKGETALAGSSLENAVLDVLWRFRESAAPSPSPPPARHIVLRRTSPAPWQLPRGSTPVASSPGSGISLAPPPAFARVKPSTSSPFTSPRPSPRLPFASPRIPHSPSLNAYEFPAETTPGPDISGDYGSDNVDWLVNDDTASITSSTGAASGYENGSTGAGAAFMQPQQVDMSPYDILRSVLGQAKSDDEIESALEANGYDLTTAIMELMGDQSIGTQPGSNPMAEREATVSVGKSMTPNPPTPVFSSNQPRSGIVCKYFLSSGQCLRADCRFSHDLSSHICKYWMMGNCLAGDTCVFSHDPSYLVNRLSVEDNGFYNGSPPNSNSQPSFQIQDYNSFPALQQIMPNQWAVGYQNSVDALNFPGMFSGGGSAMATPPGFMGSLNFMNDTPIKRPRSRPSSRHSCAATPSLPSVDDTEAFPSLGTSNVKSAKKHHGKRGGHGPGHRDHKESTTSTLADIVRMSASPGPGLLRKTAKINSSDREDSAAAQAIPAPEHIPWLETGEKANKAYLKARQEAIKHGALRNKFLQSAAQACSRKDSRAARALSFRGQNENELMRQSYREAARQLYDEDNKQANSNSIKEIYIDLHGLYPAEAVQHLEAILLDHNHHPPSDVSPSISSAPLEGPFIYVIIGAPHHSKPTTNTNHSSKDKDKDKDKDKIGRAIRNHLNEWQYAYREFSTSLAAGSGSSSGGGGGGIMILGIDPRNYDREKTSKSKTTTKTDSGGGSGRGGHSEADGVTKEESVSSAGPVMMGMGKIRILKRD